MRDENRSIVAKVEARKQQDAFPRGAQLTAFVNQGSSFVELPIEIDVIFGEEQVKDHHGFGFVLRFRKCFLRLTFKRCSINSSSTPRYQKTLPPEDFVQLVKRTILKNSTASGKAGLSIDGLLAKVLASVGLEATAGASFQKTVEALDNEDCKSQIKYRIVEPVAGNSWRIGHEVLGDPRTLDQCLSGEYFREHSDPAGPNDKSSNTLCCVQPDTDSQKTYEIEMFLSSSIKDCTYLPIKEDDEKDTLIPEWAQNNMNKIEKAIQLKAIRNAQIESDWDVREGEFILSAAFLKVKSERKK